MLQASQAHNSDEDKLEKPENLQEIWHGTGVYLPMSEFLMIHTKARKDANKLFHLLFSALFKEEDCMDAVAFGGNQGLPRGKKLLDQNKVSAIESKFCSVKYYSTT